MQEFLSEYAGVLRTLVRSDKRDINVLSMLAEDNKQYAEGIVSTIESHILTCPAPAKLPALYVVDSIVKNVKEPYLSLFGNRLAEVFGAVWSSAMQDKRTSLSKLFNTWTGVFPQPVIDQVAARMVSTSQAAMPAVAPLTMGTTTILVQQPQQAATGYVLASGGAPVQAVVLAPAQQQPQQQFGGYGYSSGGAVAMAPQQPMHMQQPQQQNQLYFGQQQPAAQVPMYAAGPGGGQQQQPGYPPRHQSPMHAGLPSAPPAGPPQYGGSNGYAPVSPPHAWQQQQPPPQVGYSRRSPSPMPPQHQQPQHPGYGGAAHRSPARQQQQPAPAPAQPQMTSQAISSLLASLAKTGVLAAASQAASPEADPALRTTEFSPAFLKEFHPGVIAQLNRVTAANRRAFLDLAFLRKQRQREGSAASRQWYVSVDHWITGTLAASEAAPAFFQDEEAEVEPEPQFNEPEDPSQPECALSGEPFDKFYDSAHDGWYYRDARRLHGEEAQRHGVPDGAIVKTKCLAEAGGLGLGGGGGALDGGGMDGGAGSGGGLGAGAGDPAGLAAEIAAAAAAVDAPGDAAAAAAAAPGGSVAGMLDESKGDAKDGADVKEGGDVKDAKDAALLTAAPASDATAGVKRDADGSASGDAQPPDAKRLKAAAEPLAAPSAEQAA